MLASGCDSRCKAAVRLVDLAAMGRSSVDPNLLYHPVAGLPYHLYYYYRYHYYHYVNYRHAQGAAPNPDLW